MLAVIMTGGKQYKVIPDQTLEIDRLKAEEGSEVTFDNVLLMQNDKEVLVGDAVAKVSVVAKVLAHTRGRKINVVKFKRRKRYLRNIGHRQQYTKIQIVSISEAGQKAAKKPKAEAKKPVAKKADDTKAAAKKPAAKKTSKKAKSEE